MNKVKTPWYKFYDGIREHLEYPNISLYDMVLESSVKYPNNISYEYFNIKVTYKKFNEQILECAKAYKKLGIGYKDKVSICMPNTPEAIISLYALNNLGAVANIIHPLSSIPEIERYLELSDSKAILCVDVFIDKIEKAIEGTSIKCIVASPAESLSKIKQLIYKLSLKKKVEYNEKIIKWAAFINDGRGEVLENKKYGKDELATILYSSGTTNFPKGVMLTNSNFVSMVTYGIEICDCFTKDDKTLAILPIFHGFGLGLCILAPHRLGACTVLIPKFKRNEFGTLIKKYKPTTLIGVPTLFEGMLENEDLQKTDLSFLKFILCGGDSLTIGLKEKIEKFLHSHNSMINIREGYGMTECVAGSCITPKNHYKSGSIGVPCPDVYYKIVKPNTSEELEYGEVGQIVISGPCVMKGYLKDEESTKSILKKHDDGLIWLHTDDLGTMDSDGFICFKERMNRMIVSSGYNIYPQYIENIIDEYPDVLSSCVISVPHEYKVEVPKAYITLKNGVSKDNAIEKIKIHCIENLAKYMLPYEYEIIDEIPKTKVGKNDYKKLMEINKERSEKNED